MQDRDMPQERMEPRKQLACWLLHNCQRILQRARLRQRQTRKGEQLRASCFFCLVVQGERYTAPTSF